MINKKFDLAFIKYFKSIYGKTLQLSKLEIYQRFLLGKDHDVLKVEKSCDISYEGYFTNREAYKYQYEFIYATEPSEEQLDVFIAYSIGVLKDTNFLTEMCKRENKVKFIEM